MTLDDKSVKSAAIDVTIQGASLAPDPQDVARRRLLVAATGVTGGIGVDGKTS